MIKGNREGCSAIDLKKEILLQKFCHSSFLCIEGGNGRKSIFLEDIFSHPVLYPQLVTLQDGYIVTSDSFNALVCSA